MGPVLLASALVCAFVLSVIGCHPAQKNEQMVTEILPFDTGWAFHLGELDSIKILNNATLKAGSLENDWQKVRLPHDWSILGKFDGSNPAGNQGGALPGGVGWYHKVFSLTGNDSLKNIFIRFDGVYRYSKVWINGHFVGERPNGFISFEYNLKPYLYFDGRKNVLVVRVDNSQQPNSRWYSGSGINRDVWLIKRGSLFINPEESYFYGTVTGGENAGRKFDSSAVANGHKGFLHEHLVLNGQLLSLKSVEIAIRILDAKGGQVAEKIENWQPMKTGGVYTIDGDLGLNKVKLWSPDNPYLYTLQVEVTQDGAIVDRYHQSVGFRYFNFEATSGFYLNGVPTKIKGVCLHSDFGVLGTAYNHSAMLRQLKLLKQMGCNAIRTAHNPPAPDILDLCDSMGFLVMDEAFDMWAKKKTKYDYSRDFNNWHKKDLEDQIKRDRRHPSVFMWSIGNEIREQFDTSGIRITKELVHIVKSLDTTRPVLSAMTETHADKNNIAKSGVLDVLGFNYKIDQYDSLPINFPGASFVASETASALETRGVYTHVPKDSIVYMPSGPKEKYSENMNGDWTVSAYDKVAAYWGTTHEDAWRAVKNRPFIAGTFVWTGIDYLGEPVPYPYPARSSYYGIIDQSGLVKDVYYFYQSQWSDTPVLHLLPHWNWSNGQMVDVWCYYNQADSVSLLLNGQPLGTRYKGDGNKGDNEFHVSWKVPFAPGILKAVAYLGGKVIRETEVQTAGAPSHIKVKVDTAEYRGNSGDLCYLTISLADSAGNLVPDQDKLLHFTISGQAKIVGVNNGYQAELRSFQSDEYPTWKGKCVVVVCPEKKAGSFDLKVEGDGIAGKDIQVDFGH